MFCSNALVFVGTIVTHFKRQCLQLMYLLMHNFASVDLWSVGCIMAEMISHKVLFPGKDCILA